MSHVRQQIREAIKLILIGLPNTQDKVYVNRVDPIEKGKVPALSIRTGADEKVETLTMDKPSIVMRQVDVFVTAYAVGADVDDQLDEISSNVEKAIANNHTLSGLVQKLEYMESDDVIERSERIKGVREIGFQCVYIIQENEPDIAR